MKKIIMQLLILSLFILSLTACNKDEAKETKEEHIMPTPTPTTPVEPASTDEIIEDISDEEPLDNDGFLMEVENVFYIKDRGLIALGKISSGLISVDDEVEIIDSSNNIQFSKVNSIEKYKEFINSATVGDYVGILLHDIERDGIEIGSHIRLKEDSSMSDLDEDFGIKVILIDSGGNKVNLIKEIREITECGLKEAKELVDNVPSEIIRNVSADKAEESKTRLENLGATIEIIEQE